MSINTQISTSAKNYADSLIQIYKDGIMSCEDILNNLNIIKEIAKNSSEFVDVMNNPAISNKIKFEIIENVFSNQINDKLINFLKVLVDRKRFHELNQIIEAFSINVDEIHNIKRVEVISAIEVSEDRKQNLIEKLQNKLQKTIVANWNIDKNIIGGLIIKIGDNVIDNSLKNKLENLSKI